MHVKYNFTMIIIIKVYRVNTKKKKRNLGKEYEFFSKVIKLACNVNTNL